MFLQGGSPITAASRVWKITLPLWVRRVRIWRREVGYYGEKLVLKAQELGLSTCWVALTHGRVRRRSKEEKLACVVPSVTGKTQESPQKTNHWRNSATALEKCRTGLPGHGGGASAPTAMNQQKFYFTLEETG